MHTIYQYIHDAVPSGVTLAYLVADRQPLAGGCEDTPEGRALSALYLPPVHQVASLDEARAWVREYAPLVLAPMTAQRITGWTERPHSQARLRMIAEMEGDE